MTELTEAVANVSKVLPAVAQALDEVLAEEAGTRMGFCLLVFNEKEDGYTSYVSNCEREKTREAIEFLLKMWDAGMEDIPAHERQ